MGGTGAGASRAITGGTPLTVRNSRTTTDPAASIATMHALATAHSTIARTRRRAASRRRSTNGI
jgi:hypothetical protein